MGVEFVGNKWGLMPGDREEAGPRRGLGVRKEEKGSPRKLGWIFWAGFKGASSPGSRRAPQKDQQAAQGRWQLGPSWGCKFFSLFQTTALSLFNVTSGFEPWSRTQQSHKSCKRVNLLVDFFLSETERGRNVPVLELLPMSWRLPRTRA